MAVKSSVVLWPQKYNWNILNILYDRNNEYKCNQMFFYDISTNLIYNSRKLLDTSSADQADGTLTWRRRRAEQLRSPIARQSEEQFTDGDDEILESLVKTATKAPGTRTTPRERKRTRHADRKSCKLTAFTHPTIQIHVQNSDSENTF